MAVEGPKRPLQVIERIRQATDAHDLEALVDCFAVDVVSEQPVHPERSFRGRDQIRQNWGRIFGAVPDLRAQLLRSAEAGATAWAEWEWTGTRVDGAPHLMRGVTIIEASEGRVALTRFYMEPVAMDGLDVRAAIERTVGSASPAATTPSAASAATDGPGSGR